MVIGRVKVDRTVMAYDAVGQPLAFAVERVERALMEQPIAMNFPELLRVLRAL